MTVIEDFRTVCAKLPVLPDDAATVHAALIAALDREGYDVFHEYLVELPNGRQGRIDIVATAPNRRWLAIEIDARKPRRRSIMKLMTGDWLRIICLRGVTGEPPPGIHAIVPIRVRTATPEELATKSLVAVLGKKARGTV